MRRRVHFADRRPRAIAAAKILYRKAPTTGRRRSLREISALLAADGFVTARGTPPATSTVARLLRSSLQRRNRASTAIQTRSLEEQ
jgi:hypothetical protein